MERQFPKNVRQIGNVSDEPKIYIEDYVDIYLNQLREQAAETVIGVALVGEILTLEGQDIVCIFGAMQIKSLEIEGTEIVIKEETFNEIEEERKHFFGSAETIGWCLIENGQPMGRLKEVIRIHTLKFPRDHTIFIWKNAMDKEEDFYSYKYGDLMKMGGHYIYYEKNPSMQNYMISTRKKNGVTPCEMVEDRAAKDFRSTVRTRMEEKDHQNSKLVYVTSALLVVVVMAIGISTVNNFDKMEAVQDSLETLSQSVNKSKSQTESVSEGEAMIEVGDDMGNQEAGEGDSDGTVPEVSTVQEQLGEEEYYIVQKGDTLDSISIKIYGDTSHVKAICKMNGLSDGNFIYIGEKLLLP